MDSVNSATLISASCSRSWLDQINGELWLCPDGLLRRSLGLVGTLRTGMGQTVDPTNRPVRQFTAQEIEQIFVRRAPTPPPLPGPAWMNRPKEEEDAQNIS